MAQGIPSGWNIQNPLAPSIQICVIITQIYIIINNTDIIIYYNIDLKEALS